MKRKTPSPDGKLIITGPIIRRPTKDKRGRPTGLEEFYLRASVQDYYIKFCESEVSKESFLLHLGEEPINEQIGLPPVMSLEVEICDGNWDICPDDPPEAASRIGTYIVIKRIAG